MLVGLEGVASPVARAKAESFPELLCQSIPASLPSAAESVWQESPTKLIYDRLRDEPSWDTRTWSIGHDVVGEATDDLVQLLLSVI
jgi:hypothetical protein